MSSSFEGIAFGCCCVFVVMSCASGSSSTKGKLAKMTKKCSLTYQSGQIVTHWRFTAISALIECAGLHFGHDSVVMGTSHKAFNNYGTADRPTQWRADSGRWLVVVYASVVWSSWGIKEYQFVAIAETSSFF